jgi:hypothetical protein
VLDSFGLDLDSFGRLECDDEEVGVRLVEEELLDSAVLDSFRVVLDVKGTVCGVELFVYPYPISRLRCPCCAWA